MNPFSEFCFIKGSVVIVFHWVVMNTGVLCSERSRPTAVSSISALLFPVTEENAWQGHLFSQEKHNELTCALDRLPALLPGGWWNVIRKKVSQGSDGFTRVVTDRIFFREEVTILKMWYTHYMHNKLENFHHNKQCCLLTHRPATVQVHNLNVHNLQSVLAPNIFKPINFGSLERHEGD